MSAAYGGRRAAPPPWEARRRITASSASFSASAASAVSFVANAASFSTSLSESAASAASSFASSSLTRWCALAAGAGAAPPLKLSSASAASFSAFSFASGQRSVGRRRARRARRRRRVVARLSKVGQRGEPAAAVVLRRGVLGRARGARDAEPRAVRHEIAAREDGALIGRRRRPPRGAARRPFEPLVAVAAHDEPQARVARARERGALVRARVRRGVFAVVASPKQEDDAHPVSARDDSGLPKTASRLLAVFDCGSFV